MSQPGTSLVAYTYVGQHSLSESARDESSCLNTYVRQHSLSESARDESSCLYICRATLSE